MTHVVECLRMHEINFSLVGCLLFCFFISEVFSVINLPHFFLVFPIFSFVNSGMVNTVFTIKGFKILVLITSIF